MSAAVSPQPLTRSQSPKRKRSESEDSGIPQFDGAGDAALQYAYDEDLPSDAEQVSTPEDSRINKRLKVDRPTTLDYAPHLTLRGHKRGVAAVKFSPDGRWIASCCNKMCSPTTQWHQTDRSQLPIARSRSGTQRLERSPIPWKATSLASLPSPGARTPRFWHQDQTIS